MSNLFADFTGNSHRVTQAQKDANEKQWYKDKADLVDNFGLTDRTTTFFSMSNVSDYKRKKINYDLFNNILDKAELGYIATQFEDIGELPADISNKDILSNKIKVLMGMEAKMPFSWRAVAINREATTRKEQEETKKIKEYVINEIMKPIDVALQKQAREQSGGRQMSPEELKMLESEIAEQRQAMTPEEVVKYMSRDHLDPDEILNNQLLEYGIRTKDFANKFNLGWKHNLLTADDIYYVGRINGEPDIAPVNALFFEYDRDSSASNVEDREWARYEWRLTPSQAIARYGKQLGVDEIDRIYKFNDTPSNVAASDFTFDINNMDDGETIRCVHLVWKSLMKVGFLTYKGRNGKEQLMLVDENYKLSKANGDIRIEWEWIPETHECTKLLNDIYVDAQPVPYQDKTLDNLWNSKLPYYGFTSDNLNSLPTALIDRGKVYQYYYDIIMYRIEMLMASDKGKILLMNIKAIPKSAGINTERFQYFIEANKIAFYNPNEEGNKNGPREASNIAQVLDMSLATEIDKYISLAEYIERKCGTSMGVTPQMEAQISPDEAVSNTKQNLVQSSHIIYPYFQSHNTVKRNVLQAWLDCARDRYSEEDAPTVLHYVLDDMSVKMLQLNRANKSRLRNSRAALYVSNSAKDEDAKNAVLNLAQAAMQNGKADLADIVRVAKSDSLQEVEEQLAVADKNSRDREQAAAKEQMKHEKELLAGQKEFEDTRHKNKMEEIRLQTTLKGEEDRKTAAVTALGFNENKDINENQIPDVLEAAELQNTIRIKDEANALDQRKLALEERKFGQQQDMDKHTKEMDKKYEEIDRKKANKPKSSS